MARWGPANAIPAVPAPELAIPGVRFPADFFGSFGTTTIISLFGGQMRESFAYPTGISERSTLLPIWSQRGASYGLGDPSTGSISAALRVPGLRPAGGGRRDPGPGTRRHRPCSSRSLPCASPGRGSCTTPPAPASCATSRPVEVGHWGFTALGQPASEGVSRCSSWP